MSTTLQPRAASSSHTAFSSLDKNAMKTKSALYNDCGYWSDHTSTVTASSTLELNRCRDIDSSTSSSSPPFSPRLCRSASASTFSQYSTIGTSLRPRPSPTKKRMIMDDFDKVIYNSLGSSSSPSGKQTYFDLGLWKDWRKHGIMWKTGPNPTWFSRWRKRFFLLKGNFLYYLVPQRHMKDVPVLGAIYLKNAIIKKDSMPLAKRVLKITPPVPRRMGGKDAGDDSSTFHIKFKSESDRNEWYEVLQNVSFENKFPEKKKALINSSMEYMTPHRSYIMS